MNKVKYCMRCNYQTTSPHILRCENSECKGGLLRYE